MMLIIFLNKYFLNESISKTRIMGIDYKAANLK